MTNFTVNSLEDTVIVDGLITLREAIEAANTNTPVGDAHAGMVGLDIIDFDELLSGGTITLTSRELQITDSLTINGLGADELTVSGNNASRVFNVDDGNSGNQIEVVIEGLTITGGNAAGEDFSANFGGGIFNRELLELSNSKISGNSAVDEGGGIANAVDYIDSTLKVINSNISDNLAGGDGGGITNRDRGTLIVKNSTISGNTSDGEGGGIYSFGMVEVTNSTISGNIAGTNGGGIYNRFRGDGSELLLNNSTITDNTAIAGGGIFNETLATIKHTILAENNGTTPDVEGDFDSGGYNLIGDGTGSNGFDGPGDRVGSIANPIDPLLGPLQNNGGSTETHALLAGSPAIDTGDPDSEEPPEFDQRGPGFPRVLDGDGDGVAIHDIGAFEAGGEADGEADGAINKAVFSGTGDISGIVEAFRSVVGAGGDNNGNEIGSQGEGFREINWDGGAVPFNMLGNFFNNQNPPVNGLPRGIEFSTESNLSLFGVSNPVLPADPFFGDNEFDTINPTYPEQFTTFSSPRLFAPLDLNFMDVGFFEPGVFDETGDPVPALVTGFGAIFIDVDLPESTNLEFFDKNDNLLFSQFVEPDPQGLSFLGVTFFDEPVVSKVRITSGNAPLSLGLDDNPFGKAVDVVAMDNFIYGEPVVA